MKHTQISVSRVRRATVEEKKDKRKGRILAFFLHLGMLVLAIWPFLVELPEEKTAEVQVVMIDFRQPPPEIQETSGSSREGASAPAKSGVENEDIPEPQPVEEVTPPTPEPEPQPEPEPTPVEPEPTPTPEPQPEPVEITPTEQPEIQTTKRPDPIKIPPVPPSPPRPAPEPEPTPAPPKPAPTPKPQPAPKPEPDAAPAEEKRKPINERIADFFKDNKYSGKDDEGTGAGSNPDGKEGKDDGTNESGSSGTGESGDGDGDSGDKANGSGDGWIEGLGGLSRVRISSPPISDLVKEVGRVVVKVCINKRGAVVYAEFDKEASTLKDIGHSKRSVEHVQQIVFERNDNAPDKECGRLTFRMTRDGFEVE